jgi:hypothetical protein
MIARRVEYPSIKLLRLGEVLLLLQLDRKRDGLIDRQLPRCRIRRFHR